MKKYFPIILAILFVGISCSETINKYESLLLKLDDTLSINYKETFINEENNLAIKFRSLISDGRCPLDLRCFWEGNAEIGLSFEENSVLHNFTLNTASNYFRNDTLINGYTIELIDVQPYPESDSSYSTWEYSVKIVVR